ncbi:MAG TPA: vWA domain-containing protein [Polyangiales bacterium]|nr:vWA domain-containing protein [Polyangiales bacterium]
MNSKTSKGWLALLALGIASCGAVPPDPPRTTGTAGTGPMEQPVTTAPEMPICPPDNPFCQQPGMVATATATPTNTTSTACSELPIDLTPTGVNIMVAVDGSASMGMHWSRVQTAIASLRKNHPEASFGVQVFWGDFRDFFGMMDAPGAGTNNICGEIHNKVLDIGNHTEQELTSFLGTAPPGPSSPLGYYEVSPVIEPINYYLTNASKLSDPTRTNYLLVITDGNDNCFGSFFTTKSDKLLAYQKLAIELSKINIRTIPIGFDAASMPMSDGTFGTVQPKSDLDVLGTLLKYGSSGLKDVPKVDDPTKLAEVVTKVGQNVRSCRFAIPATLDPTANVNPFELSFSINGVVLARDRHNENGWNFVNGSTNQVELFGQGCQAIQAGQMLKASKSCATDICGTAAVKVETKPRSVLLLLDGSASRIECVDGSADCILNLPNTAGGDRPLAFWEVVEHSVGLSLTAPINDDVDFGLQFFPSKNASAFACDVLTAPEIPPAPGTEITIMRQMFQKLPLGLSPVVQIMENVAAAPGKLADPSVLGAVVLLSDGGDNCSGAEGPEIVSRLGAAAKKLLDAGVKTYAVRYGSEAGRTPEGEAQLRAIVNNGGTAVVDPANPNRKPYLDATTPDELIAGLAAISDRLATCTFTLTGLPEMGRDNANLFLNGEALPFDKMSLKQNGWNWADAARTTIELYGDSCTAFKTNRRTSVVVEFGCPPVVLL